MEEFKYKVKAGVFENFKVRYITFIYKRPSKETFSTLLISILLAINSYQPHFYVIICGRVSKEWLYIFSKNCTHTEKRRMLEHLLEPITTFGTAIGTISV